MPQVQHYAGIITGVIHHEGFFKVQAVCGIPNTNQTVTIMLPVTKEEAKEWAPLLGEKAVVTLQSVEDEKTPDQEDPPKKTDLEAV